MVKLCDYFVLPMLVAFDEKILWCKVITLIFCNMIDIDVPADMFEYTIEYFYLD